MFCMHWSVVRFSHLSEENNIDPNSTDTNVEKVKIKDNRSY